MKKAIFAILGACVLVAGWAVWQNRLAPENGLPSENGRINGERTREIFLYYYNPDNDKDEAGNLMCSPAGLVVAKHEIAATQTPIQDAINLLIKGELSEDEAAAGITTEFPLDGLALKGANLADGVLTLEFDDPQNKTGGGSCRVGILRAQIQATAKQFAGVDEVRFIPEELFQP
jgi:spore germination protein GerM